MPFYTQGAYLFWTKVQGGNVIRQQNVIYVTVISFGNFSGWGGGMLLGNPEKVSYKHNRSD